MAIRPVEKIDYLVKIEHAVVSVFDKKGIEEFTSELIKINPSIKIYSTGGTYDRLQNSLSPKNLKKVSDYTGMLEIEGGLVKTLHHKLFLGYLTETYCEEHQRDLERENALPIDLVVCNLYPFSEVTSRKDVNFEIARDNTDIGGHAMVRSAAKNFHRVTVIVDPSDYQLVIEELKNNNGVTTLETRFELSKKAFEHTAAYDAAIAMFFGKTKFEDVAKCYNIQRGE